MAASMSSPGEAPGLSLYAIADPSGATVAEIVLPPGYRLVTAVDSPRAHRLGEACDVEDHTPCDVNVSVGYAQEIVEAEGLSVPAFDRLVAEGWDTPADVVAALQAVQGAASPSAAAELVEVIGYVEAATAPPPAPGAD